MNDLKLTIYDIRNGILMLISIVGISILLFSNACYTKVSNTKDNKYSNNVNKKEIFKRINLTN